MDIMGFMQAMGTGTIPLVAALFIGLMTALSPCPLATNITAIAYISRRIDNGRQTLLAGSVYGLGRMTGYVAVAALIVWFGMNVQGISFFLQNYGEKVLGPLLLIFGLLMLGIFKLPVPSWGKGLAHYGNSLAEKRLLGAFAIGMLFALSFCPFSAVLFFGMLIPLALGSGDPLLIPAVFGFGTALPVIVLSVLMVTGIERAGRLLTTMQSLETVMKQAVGSVFIAVGIYYLWIGYVA